MSRETHIETMRHIEEIQAQKGDAGCFSELYGVLRVTAEQLGILKGFLPQGEYERRMGEIRRAADELPDLHDEVVVDSVTQRMADLLTVSS